MHPVAFVRPSRSERRRTSRSFHDASRRGGRHHSLAVSTENGQVSRLQNFRDTRERNLLTGASRIHVPRRVPRVSHCAATSPLGLSHGAISGPIEDFISARNLEQRWERSANSEPFAALSYPCSSFATCKAKIIQTCTLWLARTLR